MNKNEYIEELILDGQNYIDEYFENSFDPNDEFSDIYSDLELSITGNDNGSYYCNSYKAGQAISEAMWDDDVVDAVKELGYDSIPTDKGPEGVDVIIRIALLGEVYSDLEDYFDEHKPSFDNLMYSMDYYIKNKSNPSYTLLEGWYEMLMKLQYVYE